MKTITLRGEICALVDDEDYEQVSQVRWAPTEKVAATSTRAAYVVPTTLVDRDGVKVRVPMHRFILGPIGPNKVVDHVNGDPLDNRRANLRVCSRAQNQRNMRRHKDAATPYKGVVQHPDVRRKKRWAARLTVNGRCVYCTYHLTVEEAARAYDAAAKVYHGEFARLNFQQTQNA